MLYDYKRWEKPEVKADPFSLESLIAWLEKQPASTAYDWYDIDSCLVCRYLDAVGAEPACPADERLGLTRVHRLEAVFAGHDEYQKVGLRGRWTFGAALTRARAALAAR